MDIRRYAEEFKSESATAGFFLDFDGTLSQIVDDPDAAYPIAGARPVLEGLARAFAVVVIVSGRRARDLETRVATEGVSYLGVYGAERIEDGGLLQPQAAEVWRGMASSIARDAESFLSAERISGCEVEFKDLAVSIHFRRSESQSAGEVVYNWARTLAGRRGFEVRRGRMVVELRPKTVSKAFALEEVALDKGLRWIVTAGDDFSDVEMFERAHVIAGPRAMAIGVNSSEAPEELLSVADLVVASPEEMLEMLRLFLPTR